LEITLNQSFAHDDVGTWAIKDREPTFVVSTQVLRSLNVMPKWHICAYKVFRESAM